jgi:La-related protein 7
MRQLVNTNDSLLKGTQFVELNQFLKFNKISEMTQSIRDLSLAIESSKSLKLDETKLKVKRIEPFINNNDNSDESTIYVERLPPNADQQWIRSIFETYGRVVYVKVPRFRHNNNIMGFAFVEFDSSEAVEKACRHFGAFLNKTNDSDLKQINSESDINLDSVQNNCKTGTQLLGKRTHEKTDESVCEKRVKPCDENELQTDSEVVQKTDTKNEIEMNSCVKKKKKRRRKRKEFNRDSVEENEVEVINLRVMSKKEWKSWKNKYLELQKTAMKSIKKSLLINSDNNNDQQKVESNEVKSELLNETFESGLIVKLSFSVSSNDFNEIEFKRNIRSMAKSDEIAYIDLPNNQIEFKDNQTVDRVCYIRCKTSQNTNQLVLNEKFQKLGNYYIMSGEEESNYWTKINEERNKIRSKNIDKKRKNERGFHKIIGRAEKIVTHISTVQTNTNKHFKFDD